jgi:hypothetical protein
VAGAGKPNLGVSYPQTEPFEQVRGYASLGHAPPASLMHPDDQTHLGDRWNLLRKILILPEKFSLIRSFSEAHLRLVIAAHLVRGTK